MIFQKGHKINLGKKYSEEHRNNISKALKGKSRPWLKGKHLSEKTRKKISLANTGRIITDEWRKRLSKALKGRLPITHFKKGHIPWNKGLKNVQSYKSITGKNNKNWKGDSVSYRELHKWLNKIFGKSKKCQFCNTTTAKRYDWANISKEYKRERNDWIRLCRSCHIKYDKGWR